jgi:acetyl-CoA carboxylase carboxyl transferase subunit beta
MLYRTAVEQNMNICTECNHHFRVPARERIAQICDESAFEEFLADVTTEDPLQFTDRRPYKDRIRQMQSKTGLNDAVIVGRGFIKGRPVILGAMDPEFIMASMGSVVGAKVTAAVEQAEKLDLPLILVNCSGGARMQEGMISLMQMAKTSAALARFNEKGGLYISVMADPTTAGVAASFAFLGDIIIAEPGAMIGFAGPRVIWNTIKTELPEGFQTAEFMLDQGFVDMIVHRKKLRTELAALIDYLA